MRHLTCMLLLLTTWQAAGRALHGDFRGRQLSGGYPVATERNGTDALVSSSGRRLQGIGGIEGCWINSYGRTAGVPLHTCGADQEQDGLLCYPNCDPGYTGVGECTNAEAGVVPPKSGQPRGRRWSSSSRWSRLTRAVLCTESKRKASCNTASRGCVRGRVPAPQVCTPE